MAINYLHNIDLNKNELQNAVIQVLASAPSSPVEGQIYYNSTDNKLYFYDGSNWIDASGDIKSVTSSTTATLTVTDSIGPNPALSIVTAAVTNAGTALATGDQIYDFVTGLGYSTTDNDVNVANLTARLPQITENVTIGDATDVTITTSGDLTVTGDLTVSGTTTTVNSATLNVADNIVTLNSDVTGAPSQNAGIEVNRGTSTDVAIRWNETTDKWQLTNDGSSYANITTGDHPTTATDSAEGLVELATDAEALAGTSDAVVVTPGNLAARSWVGTIGDGSTTAITVTHSLGTRDVIIQLYDASSYDTVYADVVRTTADTATITFATAPATDDIKVLVIKAQ